MDKMPTVVAGAMSFLLAIFLHINNDVLVCAIRTIITCPEKILILTCIISVLLLTAGFKSDKFSIIVGLFLPIFFLLFVTACILPLTRNMPITNLSPVEKIPIDWGIMGFVFILINGFLLSRILIIGNVEKLERLLMSVGLGFGVTSFTALLIGLIWELSISTVFLTQVAIFIITLIVKICEQHSEENHSPRNNIARFKPEIGLPDAALLTIISAHIIIAIYQTVAYPAIEWDSLAYGLNYARIIYENKKIPLIAGPSIGLEMSSNYPPGVQLLAVYLYLFSGMANDFYYRILQPIFGTTVIIATYKLAMLITKKRTVSLFSVFILHIMPVFWDNFVLETYLMYLTLMLTLSVYFFLKAYNTLNQQKERYELAGTVFCAFSSLISYIGLFSLGILILYAVYKKMQLTRLVYLVTLTALVIMPWYMRNFLLLGNPVYPFFGIGARLDPLLLNSTVQHFQNWLKGYFGLISMLCKLVVCILVSVILYFTFIRQDNLTRMLTLYLLLVSFLIMAAHVPFIRYLLISLPIFSAVLSAALSSFVVKHDWREKSIGTVVIALTLVSSINVVPFLNSTKPMYFASNKWNYLTRLYEDADAWKWINENTPQNATIATYDIREYYVERKVMALDGYDAAPLYRMERIEDAINYLKEKNVSYILSASWASPMDARMPPAYKWCVLTRYLGDPRYLPPVYVGRKGTAVYHVGSIDEEKIYEIFSRKNFIPPLKHLKINVRVTNQTNPPTGRFFIPIPLDYREGLMAISMNSYGHLLYVELWNGMLSENAIEENRENCELIKTWPPQFNVNGVENPSFVWEVNKAGYLTFLIIDKGPYKENFNVSISIDFYNYWDKNSLFVNEGLKTYDIIASNEGSGLMKILYIQLSDPAVLSINSETYGRKISLQICKDFVPHSFVTNYGKQYEIIRRQPSIDENLGEINPVIQNMFLSYGKYSILVVYADDNLEPGRIQLTVKLTFLK